MSYYEKGEWVLEEKYTRNGMVSPSHQQINRSSANKIEKKNGCAIENFQFCSVLDQFHKHANQYTHRIKQTWISYFSLQVLSDLARDPYFLLDNIKTAIRMRMNWKRCWMLVFCSGYLERVEILSLSSVSRKF